MTAPTIEQTAETIRHACNIAAGLVDDATWIHNDAYLPRRPDQRQPTRAVPKDPTNPDAVPGERFDLGTPTDPARRHYTRAATLVAGAHRLATTAIALAAGAAPPPYAPDKPVRGKAFTKTVNTTVRRLRLLNHDPIADPAVRQAAWAAANHLLEARAELAVILRNVDRKKDLPANRRCINCGDPRDEVGRRECIKCRIYRNRNNGKPRPIRRNADAQAAKARRLERGEDHGDETGGVQNGTYRVGEKGMVWERPTPRQEAS